MGKEKMFVVMFVMLSVFSLVCSARVDAQSTNFEPKLVGTWVDTSEQTWVFNANGTGTLGSRNMKYGAIEGKIVLVFNNTPSSYSSSGTGYTLIFSRDGNTLLLWREDSSYILQKRT